MRFRPIWSTLRDNKDPGFSGKNLISFRLRSRISSHGMVLNWMTFSWYIKYRRVHTTGGNCDSAFMRKLRYRKRVNVAKLEGRSLILFFARAILVH